MQCLECLYDSAESLISDIRNELGQVNVIAARWGDSQATVYSLDTYSWQLEHLDNGAQVATYAHDPGRAAAYAFGGDAQYYVMSEWWDNEKTAWVWELNGPAETAAIEEEEAEA